MLWLPLKMLWCFCVKTLAMLKNTHNIFWWRNEPYHGKKAMNSNGSVSPEPMLFVHINGVLRGNFSQRTRHMASLRS